MKSAAPLTVTARIREAEHANRLVAFTRPRKFGRVMQYQNRFVIRQCHSPAGGRNMTCKDLSLVNAVIAEESISRFGVGPVLADQGQALTWRARQLSEQ
jgi:hypothetical protein